MQNAIARNSEPPKLKPVEMESLILNQLASVGQKPVADAIGIDESTISRWKGKGGHVEQFCRFLAELGIQLAPPGAVLVRRDYLFSVETLADIGMKAVRMQPEPLGWD
ncbi:transcriptional regulator [Salmonella enterica]|uniref:Transcriptional regulator n=5 Tax=Salmonella enterica TaxID=28901 RepID=A0A5V5RCS6_SALER|nr:CII family transcriptional regulator [Salmonella enterica]EAA3660470.1 transcriptional regulator [Salmonella enterica subsp. enterica serovar Sandiego]EAA8863351.1 transcriptional regulator [Salmonella enterica subsp. enterica serovar Miami]EAM4438860.1 transcriptional regulator [Salmonella enterica subsp. enterica serovar Give]EAU5127943.1 transcriptional regulator [Salmonella enterica subsp. enterica serovar Infantis]EBF7359573.1 transcriptional regulator [Salmonella enterica subsp. enter